MFIPRRSTSEVSQQVWAEAAASGHFFSQSGLRHQKLSVCQQEAASDTICDFPEVPEVLMDGGQGHPCEVEATQTPCTTGTWLQAVLSACCISVFKGLIKNPTNVNK